MSYLTTETDVRLYYKDWGTGRPVILIHSWPLSADVFDDLGMAIADAGMRAIAYDRRGFGRSEQPWDGYDYDTLADDLAAVVEHTGSRNAALVGFSMGGGEVARYLSRHRGRHVTQAVLIASVLPYLLRDASNPEGVDGSIFEGVANGIRKDRAGFWAGFFKDIYGVTPESRLVSDEVVEWSRDVAMQASLKATLACAHAFATTDFRPDLAAFTVPTLMIHGTADKAVPIDVSSRRTVASLPGARLIEYEGAPHGLVASHKTQLASDVLQFLRSAG